MYNTQRSRTCYASWDGEEVNSSVVVRVRIQTTNDKALMKAALDLIITFHNRFKIENKTSLK